MFMFHWTFEDFIVYICFIFCSAALPHCSWHNCQSFYSVRVLLHTELCAWFLKINPHLLQKLLTWKLDCTNGWQQQKINGIRTEFFYIVWFCSCSSCKRYCYLNFSTLCDSALVAPATDITIWISLYYGILLIALQQIYLSEFLYTAWFWSRSFGNQSFLLWLHFMFWQMSTPSLFCFVFTFTPLLSTAEPNVFSELVVLDVLVDQV
jgi:hypothetical protein